MKSVFLIRHAKSSWDSAKLSDFDRPLNDRGKTDAPEMAKRLHKKNISVDLIISSPAKRARDTAELFASVLTVTKKRIVFTDALYLPSSEIFTGVIRNADDAAASIALFSHNPGITAFANSLTDIKVDDIPTCGIYAIKTTVKHWKDFGNSPAKFWFFDYPKREHR
jgi:phosphohistidine phosphatase